MASIQEQIVRNSREDHTQNQIKNFHDLPKDNFQVYDKKEYVNGEKKKKKTYGNNYNPIVSYGIILFYLDRSCETLELRSIESRKVENTENTDNSDAWWSTHLKFLIYQYRDSYEYMELMRGIWSGGDERIQLLLYYMSLE